MEKKDGSLLLCLDPKDLNKVIRREHFQIPTFEDVVSRLRGKKYFTVLDQKDSYWQVPLSEESSYVRAQSLSLALGALVLPGVNF